MTEGQGSMLDTISTRTWARLDGTTIAELRAFPTALEFDPGTAAIWSHDVTSLADVAVGWQLSGSTFAPPALTAAALATYAAAKQITLRDGGITVNVGSASTPGEVNVASDVNGRSLVTGCVQLIGVAQQNGQAAPTFPWINDDGTQLTLTSPQMMIVALKLGNFVQATYASLGAVFAAIASGSVTTIAEVDAAAWPATTY